MIHFPHQNPDSPPRQQHHHERRGGVRGPDREAQGRPSSSLRASAFATCALCAPSVHHRPRPPIYARHGYVIGGLLRCCSLGLPLANLEARRRPNSTPASHHLALGPRSIKKTLKTGCGVLIWAPPRNSHSVTTLSSPHNSCAYTGLHEVTWVQGLKLVLDTFSTSERSPTTLLQK